MVMLNQLNYQNLSNLSLSLNSLLYNIFLET